MNDFPHTNPEGNQVALWQYDRFPFTLTGVTDPTKTHPVRGDMVYVPSYQGFFKPFAMVDAETGEQLRAELKALEDAHRQALRDLNELYRGRLVKVLDKVGLRHPSQVNWESVR